MGVGVGGGVGWCVCVCVCVCVVKQFFDTSRAKMSQGKLAQAKLSPAESASIDQPALYTLTPDRPPLAACTGNKSNMQQCT